GPVTAMALALAHDVSRPASPALPAATGDADRGVDRLAETLPAAFLVATTAPTADPAAGGLTVGQWLVTNFPALYGEDGTSFPDPTGFGLGGSVFHAGTADVEGLGLPIAANTIIVVLATFAMLKTTSKKKRASRVLAPQGTLNELYG